MVDVARDRAVGAATHRSDDLLDVLLAHGRRADRATHVEHLSERVGEQADWPAWADADLVAGYRRLGVQRPCEAVEPARRRAPRAVCASARGPASRWLHRFAALHAAGRAVACRGTRRAT